MSAVLAIAVDTAKTTALSRWDALAADIAIAEANAEGKVFDYRDKWDNKQARSWVAQLRKIKGSIERARKDAKSVHLERGKAVDEAAKRLEASVQGLIEPHERELKALEAEEQSRVEAHKAVLARIAELAEGGATAIETDACIDELQRIDTSTLEEFASAGANRQLEAAERLFALRDAQLIQEAERAELEKLRAEQAEREEAERQEAVRQQAIAQERKATAAREAQAIADVLAAQQAQQMAEQRAANAERQAEASRQAEVKRQADAAAAAQKAQEAREKRAGDLERSIEAALQKLTREQVAAAIAAGTLHPAVKVDWAYA